MSAFLIFDTESVPDGRLVSKVKYPSEKLSEEAAIARAQREALEKSEGSSEFLPVTFQIPVAVAVATVGEDYELESLVCLDAPHYRPREIVRQFWGGIYKHVYGKGTRDSRAGVVTFNGRGFDFPLMEMAAFRYGVPLPGHYTERNSLRGRFGDLHIDLQELLSNYGSLRFFTGGLDLLAKMLGKPGKISTRGSDVYDLHRAGRVKDINDYCMFDTLDTYFVFLRTRTLVGALPLEQELDIVKNTRKKIENWAVDQPHFDLYLERWGDWEPWP